MKNQRVKAEDPVAVLGIREYRHRYRSGGVLAGTRCANLLEEAGVKTVGELQNLSFRDLFQIKGIGRKAANIINDRLREAELDPLPERR